MIKIRNLSEVHSISDALQDIIGNIQEILRYEVRLAKTAIREEANNAKPADRLLSYVAFAVTFAILFLLLGITYMANVLANAVSSVFSVANNLAIKSNTSLYD